MDHHDKVVFILRNTSDGNDLSPDHLTIVQWASNNKLSELGWRVFEHIYDAVKNDTYDTFACLHGIPNLRKRADGYVYWKGQPVEHYTFHGDIEGEKRAAQELARKCASAEAKGIPVNFSITNHDIWSQL